MSTRQERLNYAIVVARTNGTPVRDKQLSALGSKVVTCTACDGTGLPQHTEFRHVELCKYCDGRGYVSTAQPKPPKGVYFDVCKTNTK